MLRNYLTVAVRNLVRGVGYTVLNVSGLAVGFACVILIGLYVQHELSYDTHHVKADRTYRLIQELDTRDPSFAPAPARFSEFIRSDIPSVETLVRRFSEPDVPVIHGGRLHKARVCVSDTTFFEVFDFTFVEGDAQTALTSPAGMVITRSLSESVFGRSSAMGETINTQHRYLGGSWVVTGVVEDPPPNSMIRFDALTSHPQTERGKGVFESEWFHTSRFAVTHVVLREDSSPDQVAADLLALAKRIVGPEVPNRFYGEFVPGGMGGLLEHSRFLLQPLTQAHLRGGMEAGPYHTGTDRDLQHAGSVDIVLFSGGAAVLILLVAVLNYINLSTARSTSRSREVGLRKVLGANRRQVATQFVGESVMQAVGASIVALGIVELFILPFSTLAGRQLSLVAAGWDVWLWIGALTIVTGIVAGLYPAFILSSFRPTVIFRGSTRRLSRYGLRQLLVMCQFVVCITLAIVALTIARQITYLSSKDLGYYRDEVVIVPFQHHPQAMSRWGVAAGMPALDSFKDRLVQHPEILSAGAFNYFGRIHQLMGVTVDGQSHDLRILSGDADFLRTMGFKLAAGRFIERDVQLVGDEGQLPRTGVPVMINASAAQLIGRDDPVGLPYRMSITQGRIVGVLEDFSDEPLRYDIAPAVFVPNYKVGGVAVRLSGHDLQGALAHVERPLESVYSGTPVCIPIHERCGGGDVSGGAAYANACQVVHVPCPVRQSLGLFGLATFSAHQRTKEIGIRKVLGADGTRIVLLLSSEYLRIVVSANLIAWPIGWYAANRWLDDFAHRIEPGPIPFLTGALLGLVVALVAVLYQAASSAKTEPVHALRHG